MRSDLDKFLRWLNVCRPERKVRTDAVQQSGGMDNDIHRLGQLLPVHTRQPEAWLRKITSVVNGLRACCRLI
jgi:hypothetical protein